MDVNLDRVVCSWSCSGRDVEVCGVCGSWFCDYHFPSHPHPDLVGNEQPAAIRHCPGAEWPHKPHWWDSAGRVHPCDGEPNTQAGNASVWPTPEVDEAEIRPAPHVCHCACRRNWGGPCGPCTCEMTPEQMKAEADDIAARQHAEAKAATGWHDPAPAGLTAAQVKPWIEFGARLAARSVEVTIADTATCPDPAMHDPLRGDIAAQRDAAQKRGDAYRDLLDKARDEIAELRTGRLEAEADFEASLAREQIATERVAKLAALVECRCGPEWTERSMHGPACDQLQVHAILADQGEEA